MQVMWPGKYFSPLASCTLEWWKRQLKLFQESALSLVIRTYQTIHGEQNRTKQKQAQTYYKGTHGGGRGGLARGGRGGGGGTVQGGVGGGGEAGGRRE